VIDFCLRWRKSVVLATVLMFVVSLAGFRFVQQQFFPTSTAATELFSRNALAGRDRDRRDRRAAKAAEKLIGDDKTSRPTRLRRARARRASGSASIRFCRTPTSRRSSS
jgi:multidrug efflux pump subunit AcrB